MEKEQTKRNRTGRKISMAYQLSLLGETKRQSPYILMSLREEYFEQMKKYNKKFEYRTRYLKEPTTAFIYISKTKKSIVGKIDFGTPIIDKSENISEIAENEHPGCYQQMMKYLSAGVGYAIPVKKITLIEEVILEELTNKFPGFVVPQSYYILDKKPELLNYLLQKKDLGEHGEANSKRILQDDGREL